MERADKAPDRSTQHQPAARSVSGSASAPTFIDRSARGAELSALVQMMQSSTQVGELNSLAQMMQSSPQVTAQLARNARLSAGATAVTQRVDGDEEELLQGKFAPVQRVEGDEEELLQGKFAPIQRSEIEDEEPLQGKFAPTQRVAAESAPAPSPNQTGMPDGLKSGIESLSGISLDQVRVHYNSPQPAQLNAHAYAQGSDIHIAPGQEQHLPHEAWHVVQQAQGRVKPTMQLKDGVPVNDDAGLEHEADVMGAKAASAATKSDSLGPYQRQAETAQAHPQKEPVGDQGELRPLSFPTSRMGAEQESVNSFAKAPQQYRALPIAGSTSIQQQRCVSIQRTSDPVHSIAARPVGAVSGPPIQMVKIMVDGLEYETNGKSYDELLALKDRVAPEHQKFLEHAMRIAFSAVEREPASESSSSSSDQSTLRHRGTTPAVKARDPDQPMPSPPTPLATVSGYAAHGPRAWASTGGSILTGAPDVAALNNSVQDTRNMASRAKQDAGKRHFKDAAISATQSVLSGAQVVLSTPVAHALNHGVGAALGLPIPVPAADALWYPANAAKKGLEGYRDPKEKTK